MSIMHCRKNKQSSFLACNDEKRLENTEISFAVLSKYMDGNYAYFLKIIIFVGSCFCNS